MKPIYHGTVQKDLEMIKPFKRFTPGGADLADQIPPRIYATYNPAYAVAHSFPWSSKDGIDIKVNGDNICIVVPKEKAAVLAQAVCVYTLPDTTFTLTTEEETGLTYHSEVEVKPIEYRCFANVTEAIVAYDGIVEV